MRRRSTYTTRTEKHERKQANTIFNEVRQFAYFIGARGRDFIDSTINYNLFLVFKKFSKEIFRGIQFMRALTLIYKPESPRVLGNPDWIRLQFRKEVWIRSGDSFACWSAGRPGPTESQGCRHGRALSLLRSTGRSTELCLCTPVDRVSPGLLRAAFSLLGFRFLRYLFQWV